MAKVILNKKCFTNLAKGIHNIKVNFKDGFAAGHFQVNDVITFYVFNVECTATAGMTWVEWFESCGSRSGTSVAQRNHTDYSDNKIYVNWNHPDSQFSMGSHHFDSSEYLNNSSGVTQELDTVIVNGMRYSRASGGGGADEPM